ncbi:COG1361 family protein [Actinokineospora bangkokensis]|uniref:Gram-positive cocci surface proteins LPxTG domain-containing protein n=1 Tax=Actinokineospora bangkokensis TaxID=1193682 RepID=A0A1Q9LK33_9PSEU|nr:hypothetical protein [Actinokineospora bangkokensis]OLR92406.1 hypothetical protein BJP25_20175 [Actinokineospora bangkokensis]
MRAWAVLALAVVLALPVFLLGPSAPVPTPVAAPGVLPPPPAAPVEPDLREAVYGDFLLVGNSSLRCPVAGEVTGDHTPAECAQARAGQRPGGLLDNSATNNGYFMHLADDDTRPATFTSSRAVVVVPAGARVKQARLSWGGHTGMFLGFSGVNCVRPLLLQGDPPPAPAAPSPAQQRVGISLGGAAPVEFAPQGYRATEGLTEPSQVYSAWADVTSVFTGTATGAAVEVSVSDVWVPTGPGCAGGWSLAVVFDYGQPTARYPHPRVVDFYSGTLPQGGALLPGLLEPLIPGFPSFVDALLPGLVPGLTGTAVSLPGVSPKRSQADVAVGLTAFDGDWGQGGERFTVDGEPVAEPCTGGEDFFRSCALGAVPPVVNTMGVDAKVVRPALADNDDGSIEVGVQGVEDFVAVTGLVLAETVTPAISVDVTGPDAPVREGDLAPFAVVVTNTGTMPLRDIRVDAGAQARCAPAAVPPLAPGGSARVTCVQPAGPGRVQNRTVVTGTYLTTSTGDARTVSATGQAFAEVTPADLAVRRVPDKLLVHAGEPVRFAVTLVNNTDVFYSGVRYVDGATPTCTGVPQTLPGRSSAAFECVLPAARDSFASQGSMTAVDAAGNEVRVQSQAVTTTVIAPTVALTGRAEPETAYRGSPVVFSLSVTHTGAESDGPLYDAVITVPGCEVPTIPAVEPGATVTASCTAEPERSGPVAASVSARDGSGYAVTATTTIPLTLLEPRLEVTQEVVPTVVRTGAPVEFTMTARNTGTAADGDLTDVRLDNPTIPPSCAPDPIPRLAPGESGSVSCTAVPDRSFSSVAVGRAQDSQGRAMSVTAAEVPVAVTHPSLAMQVAVEPESARHGARADFSVVVRNTGDVPVEVSVRNDQAADCDLVEPSLRAGAAQGVRCQVDLPRDEAVDRLVNTARYTANPVPGDGGAELGGESSATVRVLAGQAPQDPSAGPDPGADPGTDPGGDPTPQDGITGGTGGTGSPTTGGAGQGTTDGLASTGASVAGPLALGVGLLVAGAMALVLARGRRRG